MQKGRNLLIFFSFFITSFLLFSAIFAIVFSNHPTQVLAAKTHIKRRHISPTPTKTPTPIPTRTPTPLPTSTPTLTKRLTPSPTKSIPPTTKLLPSPTISVEITEYILQKVNEYRTSRGLAKAVSNTETCNFAKIRAEEISHSFTHDGFEKRINEKTLPYSDYHEVTENIAYNTDYKDVVPKWIASSGHAENMRADTPFICIGKAGDYYSYEGWKP